MYPSMGPESGIPIAPPVDDQSPIPDPSQPPPNPLVTLPVPEGFIDQMFKEVEAAEARRRLYETEWDILLKAYCPIVTESGTPEEAKTNVQFRNVHSKLAQVFYQHPELFLEPRSPMKDPVAINPQTGQPITSEDALAMKREVLNDKLGDDGACAAWTMDQILLDCLTWAGVGVAMVGYTPTIKNIQEPILIPDPNFIPPPVLPGSVFGLTPPPQPPMVPMMQEDGTPATRTVPVVVYEDWYFRRISPKKALISADLRESRIEDDACWVGQDLFLTKEQIQRIYRFDPESLPAAIDDRVGENSKESASRNDPRTSKYHLYELFLRACEYDPSQPHPKAIYHLVLMAGMRDKPIVYRPHPDQTFDDRGRLTPDSIDSFPLKFCTLRDHPDSPYVYSDAAFVHSDIKVLNTSRRQSVRLRDAAVAKMLYDEDALTPEDVERIRNSKAGDFIGVKSGQLAAGKDSVMTPASQMTRTRDDDALERSVKHDIDESLGISAQDAGVLDERGAKTATEVANASTKATARLSKDRQRAARFYLRCVRHFDALIIRYATAEDYVSFLGKTGEQRLEMWNGKMLGGKWSYGIKLDSQLIMDVARDRQQLLGYMEKTQQDPVVNRYPIHKKLARSFGLDPVEVLVNPALVAAPLAGPTPSGPMPASAGPVPMPSPADNRPHRPTGARPNTPEFGAHPNTPRPQ